jgi:hypothetical protein
MADKLKKLAQERLLSVLAVTPVMLLMHLS